MRRRPGLVWPIVLLLVGFLLLFNNLGIISWSIWGTLWQFWPVILILIGLEILARQSGSTLAYAGAVLIGLIIVFGIVAFAVMGQGVFPIGQPLETRQISENLGDIHEAQVIINMGAGSLEIDSLGESDALVQGTLELPRGRGSQVAESYNVSGTRGVFELRSTPAEAVFWPFFGNQNERWRLSFTSQIPLDMQINTGAGQSQFNLQRLQVNMLRLNTGVGETSVILPAEGQVSAEVDGGIGSVAIEVPPGTPARIEVHTGIGTANIDQSRFREVGDNLYETDNYTSGESRIDLTVHAGIGTITVR
jgi:hypothetical protein